MRPLRTILSLKRTHYKRDDEISQGEDYMADVWKMFGHIRACTCTYYHTSLKSRESTARRSQLSGSTLFFELVKGSHVARQSRQLRRSWHLKIRHNTLVKHPKCATCDNIEVSLDLSHWIVMVVQRLYGQSACVRPEPCRQIYLGGINLDGIPSCDRNGSRCWTTRDWRIDRAGRDVTASFINTMLTFKDCQHNAYRRYMQNS